MDINVDLIQYFINFLIKKLLVEQLKVILSKEKLAEEFHKQIIRKFKKWEVYSSFLDNIWAADLQICNW